MTDGPQFLHNDEIALRDLNPANIRVSNNKHYTNITDAAQLRMAIKNNPIQCKLTDFRELRSLIHQTTEAVVWRCSVKKVLLEIS